MFVVKQYSCDGAALYFPWCAQLIIESFHLCWNTHLPNPALHSGLSLNTAFSVTEYTFSASRESSLLDTYEILPNFLKNWGITDIRLYKFQVYNAMICYWSILQNDHHGKSSQPPHLTFLRVFSHGWINAWIIELSNLHAEHICDEQPGLSPHCLHLESFHYTGS